MTESLDMGMVRSSNLVYGLRYISLRNQKRERYLEIRFEGKLITRSHKPVRVTEAIKHIECFVGNYRTSLLGTLSNRTVLPASFWELFNDAIDKSS